MPRLQAQAMLEEARAGRLRLDADGWYELTRLATGDEEKAAEAMSAYIKQCYRANITPE